MFAHNSRVPFENSDGAVDLPAHTGRASWGQRLLTAPSAIARIYHVWATRIRDRSELARLSDRELRDFMSNRYEADHEVSKPFWRR